MNIEEFFLEKLKKADDKNPLKIAYDSQHIYYQNFIEVLKEFENYLTEKELKELIDKVQLGSNFDYLRYLQFASEITVVYYILRYYNKGFKYEPIYNGKKNPECSFEYKGKTINIEVKCPDLSSKIDADQKDNIKIYPDRIPNEIYPDFKKCLEDLMNKIDLENSHYSGIKLEKRLDNKLKDYIISASNKFPIDSNSYFNILAVSLEAIEDLDEWYSYIFGECGIFTDNSFVSENYNNVDAILLTTPGVGHYIWKNSKENVWKLEEYPNFLFLNPKKVENEDFYSKNAISIFGGLTAEFLNYLKSLDNEESLITNNYIEKFTKFINQIGRAHV